MITFDPVLEIYITNECNLTCSNCNRYNNYNFTGHYYWEDQKDLLTAWSKRITSPLMTLIGGEPTMHPDLTNWVLKTSELWPDSKVMIQTNGVKKVSNVMNGFDKISRETDGRIGQGIAVHNTNFYPKFSQHVNDDTMFDATEFSECALVDKGSHFVVHDSDPDDAYSACTMQISYTLFNGLLYKCPMVALLPEFRKQYDVHLTDKQEELLYSYKPLHPSCTDEELDAFVAVSKVSIPQCNLCPGQYKTSTVTFTPSLKKRKKLGE